MNNTKDLKQLYLIGIEECKKGNFQKGVEIFRYLARMGDKDAMMSLGQVLKLIGQFKEGFIWTEKAANLGVKEAILNIAIMYYRGEGVECSVKEAINWLDKLYEMGYFDEAFSQMAYAYLQPADEAQRDLDKVFYYAEKGTKMVYKYFPKPIKNARIESPFILGLCYQVGIGTEVNLNEAMKYYDYCIKANRTEAMLFASRVLADPDYEAYNLRKAIALLKKSIKLGDNAGYKFLGDLYFEYNNKAEFQNALKYYNLYLESEVMDSVYYNEVNNNIKIIKSQLEIA